MKTLPIIIITGFSGSGKSTALAALEDSGFFCVDNLPVELLPKFLELPIGQEAELAGLAFVMDLREKGFVSKFPPVVRALKESGYQLEVFFLESSEDVLVRRYSQTRRQHPLAKEKSVKEGIRAEKELFKKIRSDADRIIDTTSFNVHELKAIMKKAGHKARMPAMMKINIISFGFKYGLPQESDLVFDVRFLANPYFVPDLKELDGRCKPVFDYIFKDENTGLFLKKSLDLIDFLIPLYEKEGKGYLTIAIGCTGGRHRSVAVSNAFGTHIKKLGKNVSITHRDIEL